MMIFPRHKIYAIFAGLSLSVSMSLYAQQAEPDYSEVPALAVPERQMPLANYQQDFKAFSTLLEKFDMSILTSLGEDDQPQTKEHNQQAIKMMKDLNKAIAAVRFSTPEGQQAKADFIAFNDASVDVLLKQSTWENNPELQEKLSVQVEALNAQFMQSMIDLKQLAED